MAQSGIYINDYSYQELSQNYDPIYDTLMEGGVVWMHLNFNNAAGWAVGSGNVGEDGYVRFMVSEWCVNYRGLNIQCPDGSVLCFPNGSHHTPSQPN